MPADRSAHRSWVRPCVFGIALALLPSVLALSAPLNALAAPTPAETCPPPPASPIPGGEAGPAAKIPAAIPAPAQVVLACVGSFPITGAAFDHWATVARKSTVSEHTGKHHSKSPPPAVGETITEVMGFLISSDWVLEEGSALGISLSEATVRRHFDRIRDEQFPHRREFRKFLRQSAETVGDLLMRVRLNLLSSAIMSHVTASAEGSQAKQRALSDFVKGFKARWQAQTECVPAFTAPDCGSIQQPL